MSRAHLGFWAKNANFIIGGSIVGILLLLAVLAPFISPFDPMQLRIEESLLGPGGQYLFGTEKSGADILSILLHGTRLSFEIGVTATLVCVFIGLVLGSIAGYFGGWLDSVLMRMLDIIFAFPGIILAIAIATVMGASKTNVIFALIFTGWAGYTRLVRGEVRSLREKEYIQAAEAIGLSTVRIIVFHIWPNLVSPILVAATFGIAGCILTESSLSFLGIGVPPGTPSWGALLDQGRDVLIDAPHVSTFPGLAIMITILGFNFLGEGLRERLDPKG